MKRTRRNSGGFTLLELLAVVAIMGILATASIGSYRTMRQGIEERGVLNASSQFLKTAYQRSRIDCQPICLYVWNETTGEESADGETSVSICGHMVAVRRMGRVSAIYGSVLIDEFGDLSAIRYTDANGQPDDKNTDYKDSVGTYLYRMNGDETGFNRSVVSQVSLRIPAEDVVLMTDPDNRVEIDRYGLYVIDKGNIEWQIGDAYGMEFNELVLPNGYIFGSSYSESSTDPVKAVKVIRFNPLGGSSGASETLVISAVRLSEMGTYTVRRIDETGEAGSEANE